MHVKFFFFCACAPSVSGFATYHFRVSAYLKALCIPRAHFRPHFPAPPCINNQFNIALKELFVTKVVSLLSLHILLLSLQVHCISRLVEALSTRGIASYLPVGASNYGGHFPHEFYHFLGGNIPIFFFTVKHRESFWS